jgi:hypothetical protein
MPTPRARDEGLRRIRSITGWVAAASVSAAALISVGVARASTNATSKATTPAGTGVTDPGLTDPGFTSTGPGDAWGATGSAGLQPPVNPPTQGIGGGQAVSGGS